MPSTKEDYPFKFVKKGESSDREARGEIEPLYTINEGKKSKSAFWAQSGDISLLAYRQDNGSIVNLSTSDKKLGADQWIFASGVNKKRYVEFQVSSLEAISEKMSSLLNVRELTKYQGDSIWFLLRRGRTEFRQVALQLLH